MPVWKILKEFLVCRGYTLPGFWQRLLVFYIGPWNSSVKSRNTVATIEWNERKTKEGKKTSKKRKPRIKEGWWGSTQFPAKERTRRRYTLSLYDYVLVITYEPSMEPLQKATSLIEGYGGRLLSPRFLYPAHYSDCVLWGKFEDSLMPRERVQLRWERSIVLLSIREKCTSRFGQPLSRTDSGKGSGE